MVFDAAVLGVVVGLLLGGSLKSLWNLQLKRIPLLLVSLAVSLLPRAPFLGVRLAALGTPGAITLGLTRYGFLIAFAVCNIRVIPLSIVGVGGLLNCIVTTANGGVMPVSPVAATLSGGESQALLKEGLVLNYRLADSSTRLATLGDNIQFRFHGLSFLSIGDLVIAAGVFLLVVYLMKPKRLRRFRRADPEEEAAQRADKKVDTL